MAVVGSKCRTAIPGSMLPAQPKSLREGEDKTALELTWWQEDPGSDLDAIGIGIVEAEALEAVRAHSGGSVLPGVVARRDGQHAVPHVRVGLAVHCQLIVAPACTVRVQPGVRRCGASNV